MSLTAIPRRRLALVMGVANHRSIAWACVQEFLAQNTDCIVTYHPRFAKHVQRLVAEQQRERQQDKDQAETKGKILGHYSCQVETEIPYLFQTQLPELLQQEQDGDTQHRLLDAIVHSVAFADMEQTKSLAHATWDAYATAQHVSSFSLVETARCAQPLLTTPDASLTALSYIGAVRALPAYNVMGPAKAALEANVRGLAAEYGYRPNENSNDDSNGNNDKDWTTHRTLRVNAVSAGPVATLSSRGITNFSAFAQQVADVSPLRRHVTRAEIASTVHFVSTASGITGQTIYVDAGYSAVVPVFSL